MSVMQIQRLSPVLTLSRDLKVRVVVGRQLSGSAKQTMQRTICMDVSCQDVWISERPEEVGGL